LRHSPIDDAEPIIETADKTERCVFEEDGFASRGKKQTQRRGTDMARKTVDRQIETGYPLTAQIVVGWRDPFPFQRRVPRANIAEQERKRRPPRTFLLLPDFIPQQAQIGGLGICRNGGRKRDSSDGCQPRAQRQCESWSADA
jgi:hypothetical protein